ncbi:MAG: putative MAPEG superfamily protein [Myxococcota bacterium]|jgi:uncharacterized MAPEG superfamily protein
MAFLGLSALQWLVLSILLTAVMWLPYVLNRAQVWGLNTSLGYPAEPKPLSAWAQRAKKAHANAIENLVLFAPLVIIHFLVSRGAPEIALWTALYFFGRLAHYLVYAAGIPYLRTATFAVGYTATLVIGVGLL